MSETEPTPDYLLSDFDRKVEAGVRRVLQTPSRLPAEFLGFIGPYIENQAIQLPVSQIVGNFLVENTTAKMGGDVHGRPGTVRGGSTPYEFYHLVYDKVYGKWVSDEFLVCQQVDAFSTSSATYQPVDSVASFGILPWNALVDAGLKPQFNLSAVLLSAGASVARASIALGTFDDDALVPSGTVVSWNIAVTGTTARYKVSGWQDHGLTLAANDHVLVVVQLQTSNAADAATITSMNLKARWVSV